MSKGGHALAALAAGGFIALAGHHAALLGAATALAGQLPDTLEGVVGFGPGGERRSLVPHRTLTHSPWPWAAAIVLGLLLPALATPWGAIAVGKVIAGSGAGALVHVALDLFSPTGIPLGNPFGARVSVGPFRSHRGHPYLYRTSTREEWPLLVLLVLILVVEVAAMCTRLSSAGFPAFGALLLRALQGF